MARRSSGGITGVVVSGLKALVEAEAAYQQTDLSGSRGGGTKPGHGTPFVPANSSRLMHEQFDSSSLAPGTYRKWVAEGTGQTRTVATELEAAGDPLRPGEAPGRYETITIAHPPERPPRSLLTAMGDELEKPRWGRWVWGSLMVFGIGMVLWSWFQPEVMIRRQDRAHERRMAMIKRI